MDLTNASAPRPCLFRAERRRSRTYPATGYAASPVLKITLRILVCRPFACGAPVGAPVRRTPSACYLVETSEHHARLECLEVAQAQSERALRDPARV
jgi:hypothetical protein